MLEGTRNIFPEAPARTPARTTAQPSAPRWPGMIDFYGQGILLLSRTMRASEAWTPVTAEAKMNEGSKADFRTFIRLLGAATGEGLLVLHFEREDASTEPGSPVFEDEGARLELANIVAGRLLDHPSPWGDQWEWCTPPVALADEAQEGASADSFAVEYAFQERGRAPARWWITATLARASDLPQDLAHHGSVRPAEVERLEAPCST